MNLLKKDYLNILDFYNINYTNKTPLNQIKLKAEKILAEKLCKCIKKVKSENDNSEERAISICQKSVLKRKKLKSGRFSCKKGAKFLRNKTNKQKLTKL
tara:strand:- start:999 stop:1295 length:297 start_codon:yes stop_codon:yes gene_type:complete